MIPYRCDLSNEEDILSMFSAVRSQHSGVDICINNAGLARPDTLLSGSTRGWKEMFNVRPGGGEKRVAAAGRKAERNHRHL